MQQQPQDLAARLREAQATGTTYAAIAAATGVSRTAISQLGNGKIAALGGRHEEALWGYLTGEVSADQPAPKEYKQAIELYETAEFVEAIGWCSYVHAKRKMGVLVGHPGSGKTTIMRHFAGLTHGTVYIEAWPNMRMGDLLGAIAQSLGVALQGNTYHKAQQLIAALSTRTDVSILIDEAEYLRKWDVDKFEVLRKLWDNTGTPIIMAGTLELETLLTRGSGRDNLAQLYRRKVEIKLKGIKKAEARAILKGYNVAPDVIDALCEIAADVKHGGMGNFVEVLDICLEAAGDRQINRADVMDAKRYKLLF